MSLPTNPDPIMLGVSHLTLVKVARDLAMDFWTTTDIMLRHKLSSEQWTEITSNPVFIEHLHAETLAWQSASNTAERVRLKSLAFVEEALPEFYARAHDTRESLSAKVEVLKTVARLGGIGERSSGDSASIGERFSVTINLGGAQALKIEKEVTSKVIDGEVL